MISGYWTYSKFTQKTRYFRQFPSTFKISINHVSVYVRNLHSPYSLLVNAVVHHLSISWIRTGCPCRRAACTFLNVFRKVLQNNLRTFFYININLLLDHLNNHLVILLFSLLMLKNRIGNKSFHVCAP